MSSKTAKKESFIKRIPKSIARFFRDTRGEMKKVVWPSRKQVLNNLLVVAGFVLICAVLIFLLDLAFGWALGFVIDLAAPAA